MRRKAGIRTAVLNRENVPLNLFSLLEKTYKIFALEPVSRLAPENQNIRAVIPPLFDRFEDLLSDSAILYAHLVVPMPFREKLPPIEGQWRDFRHPRDDGPEEASGWPYRGKALPAKQFVDLLQRRREPAFYFLHLLLPHFPFEYNERGQMHPSYFPFISERLRKATGTNTWPNETVADLAYQAHLLQLSFTDLLLGRILDRLVQLGSFDETLLIVTADHGISFYWDGDGLSAARLSDIQASDTLYVPLMIKLPGQRDGAISDTIVERSGGLCPFPGGWDCRSTRRVTPRSESCAESAPCENVARRGSPVAGPWRRPRHPLRRPRGRGR